MPGKVIQNYIAAIAVVVFGLWLFSEKPLEKKSGINNSYDYSDVYSESEAEYINNDQVFISEETAAVLNGTDSVDTSFVGTHTAETSANDAGMEPAIINSDDVSDGIWYSGIMKKARSISDRIIHIDITGNTNNGKIEVTGENNGMDVNDENNLLPQPTESEVLAENKPNCSAMLYMGGNAYGRNMLIKMGCPVP